MNTIAAPAPVERTPWLESWVARLGVAVLVALSISIGFTYWEKQGDEQMAVVTVAAELIAFAGLVLVRYQWTRSKAWASVGFVLTFLAASWCGLTMFEKIRDDSRERAIEAAQSTLAYRTASREFTEVSALLTAALAERGPTCICPDTIREWEAAQTTRVDRLTVARDAASNRMEAATPPVETDYIAIARGIGVETIKLLGFAAFGLMVTPAKHGAPMAPRPTPSNESPKRPSWWRRLGAVAKLATLTTMIATPAHSETLPVASDSLTSGNEGESATIVAIANDPKSKAFALRDKMDVPEIARVIDRDKSTVYRWFRDHDRKVEAEAAATARATAALTHRAA